ncbi:helix-turn-helix domain-containing protein [endosymbiont 'TC1' of Trimyema compressum]
MSKIHSKEEKLSIVKRYLSGESRKNLSKETGISESNIHKWE